MKINSQEIVRSLLIEKIRKVPGYSKLRHTRSLYTSHASQPQEHFSKGFCTSIIAINLSQSYLMFPSAGYAQVLCSLSQGGRVLVCAAQQAQSSAFWWLPGAACWVSGARGQLRVHSTRKVVRRAIRNKIIKRKWALFLNGSSVLYNKSLKTAPRLCLPKPALWRHVEVHSSPSQAWRKKEDTFVISVTKSQR